MSRYRGCSPSWPAEHDPSRADLELRASLAHQNTEILRYFLGCSWISVSSSRNWMHRPRRLAVERGIGGEHAEGAVPLLELGHERVGLLHARGRG